MMKQLSIWIVVLFVALAQALSAPAFAQDDKLSKEELDQLLAPIALYPDDLLTNVLMASTYPLDVVRAARWKKEPANAKLKGDALVKALEAKDWDPSIKALVQFPKVLEMMSDELEWTQKLGDAFLAQQDEVLDEIQLLRAKADEAGNLKSNKQQKVVKESGEDAQPVYIIEPATPETVYVPVYEPSVVYGSWWYPDYPPYYWDYPGATYVNGFYWGAGIAVAAGIWGWNRFDWHRHDIDIDVDRWNNINVNRAKIASDKWEHRPERRGQVPYKGKEVRDKFKQADRRPGNKDFRGYDKGEIEAKLKDVDRDAVKDKLKDVDRDAVKDKLKDVDRDAVKGKLKDVDRDAAKGKLKDVDRDAVKGKLKDVDRGAVKDKVGDRAGPKIKDKTANLKARDLPKSGNISKVSRDIDRPKVKAKKPSPGAFDVKRGADVRKHAARGHASRVAMKGGGGGRRGGGGGGRGGGGRRR